MPLHPNNIQAREHAKRRRVEALGSAQSSANHGKESLMGVMRYLESFGLTSQAAKLGRIIARLEAWQNGRP